MWGRRIDRAASTEAIDRQAVPLHGVNKALALLDAVRSQVNDEALVELGVECQRWHLEDEARNWHPIDRKLGYLLGARERGIKVKGRTP